MSNFAGINFTHLMNGNYFLTWNRPGIPETTPLTQELNEKINFIYWDRALCAVGTAGLTELAVISFCVLVKLNTSIKKILNLFKPTPPEPVHIPTPLEPGHILYSGKGQTRALEFSTKKPRLGKGVFGTAYISREDESMVIKKSERVQDPDKIHQKMWRKEFQMGRALNHPFFVKVHELAEKTYSDGSKKYKIKMERAHGKTLQAMDTITRDQVKKILSDALDCLRYLYNNKFAWSDVKSDNIIINNDQIKFIDFERYVKAAPNKEHLLLSSLLHEFSIGLVERGLKKFEARMGDSLDHAHPFQLGAFSGIMGTIDKSQQKISNEKDTYTAEGIFVDIQKAIDGFGQVC